MSNLKDFYPTRPATVEKMLDGLKLSDFKTVLDVGAGKGDIADFIKNNPAFGESDEDVVRTILLYPRSYDTEVDVIEINEDLQKILKGKGYKLVHDDFLSFHTYKPYDLIIANFPFSLGAECLQKAINLITSSGGHLRCLVNAETILNPCTNLRKAVARKLEKLGAEIEFLEGEFAHAERKSGVEVALIKLKVEQPSGFSVILDDLKKAKERSADEESLPQALAPANFVGGVVASYNVECELGIKFISEYYAVKPYILDSMDSEYSSPILELKIGEFDGKYRSKSELIKKYLEKVRRKYWNVLLKDTQFRSKYTSNIIKDLETKLSELVDYDFSEFNIRKLEKELAKKISQGIHDAILKMFDAFSRQFAYHSDSDNIHYYNGWKTNKAWKINEKIILPMNGFSSYSWDRKAKLDDHYIVEKLEDMVKVFNYLASEELDTYRLVAGAVNTANQSQNFRKMDLRYFETTFFKKGTCHITFKNKKLLDKFNIYGSQRKGWLPPGYGTRSYEEMTPEEKAVVDDFQGKEAYEIVVENPDYYLIQPETLMLQEHFE